MSLKRVYPCVRYGLVDGRVEPRTITGPEQEREGWEHCPAALRDDYPYERLWPCNSKPDAEKPPAETVVMGLAVESISPATVTVGSAVPAAEQPPKKKHPGGRPRKIKPAVAPAAATE